MQRHVFAAMGTTVDCLLEAEAGPDTASAFTAAEAEFHRLESLLSRFRPESELSTLNRAGSLRVGPDLVRVVALALDARERTEGRFDPTVHDAVVAAGYDRSFEEIAHEEAGAAPAGARCGGRVRLDEETGVIELEPGTRLDLGGIAKGDAADRACAILGTAGPCLVNAGGDISVSGVPRAGFWPVGLNTPGGPLTIGLERGGLATSGRDRRRWRRGTAELHHLIDPATGSPATGGTLRVTVVAESGASAETLATSLFLAGESAPGEADRLGTPSVIVTGDGRTVLAGGLA
jgi:thiamine biosynthesis lipoprotein